MEYVETTACLPPAPVDTKPGRDKPMEPTGRAIVPILPRDSTTTVTPITGVFGVVTWVDAVDSAMLAKIHGGEPYQSHPAYSAAFLDVGLASARGYFIVRYRSGYLPV